ncbi:MAG: hypothetical protein AB7C90_02470 [Bacteroidales bacterium]
MNVSDIITEFGAYYEQAGQNKNRILAMLTQGLVTPSYCTPVKTDDTIFKLGQLVMGNIVQAFQKGWTPKNPAAFTPNELRLYKLKIDEEIDPDDIEAIWLGFLASESVNRKDWPIVKFLIEHPEQGYIAAINRDMELYCYGKGEYQAPTPNEAGVTSNAMTGYIKLLTDGVAAGTINSVNIGALDKDTIFDQVELFTDGISEIYQNVAMNVFMSPSWAKKYHRDKRAQGFYSFAGEDEIKKGITGKIDFTPQQVVGLPSLSGTDTIFATPKANFVHLTKKGTNKNKINIEEAKRSVFFLADWWEGIGFGIDAAVWTNITPSGSGSSSAE